MAEALLSQSKPLEPLRLLRSPCLVFGETGGVSDYSRFFIEQARKGQ
jgi:hypothetical protein